MKKLQILLTAILLLNVAVSVVSQNPRNVVIEYTTSTQCGGCPCLDSVLQQVVLVRHPQTIVLACHTEWSHFGGYHGQLISDSLNAGGGDPSAVIDRTIYNVEGFPAFVDSVDSWFAKAANAPVSIEVTNKSYNAATRTLALGIDAKSLEDTLSGLYRINLVIVEGNIMYQQSAHPPCTGGPNYIHYDVVRNMVNEMYGDTLINGVWTKNLAIHKIFTTVLDSSWVDRNCDFIVYVYKQKPGALRKVIDYHMQQGIRSSVTGALSAGDLPGNAASALTIYPNPTSDHTNVHISLDKQCRASFCIMNLEGKVVMDLFNRNFLKGEYNLEINTGNLVRGVYQCILRTDQDVKTEKLVIL